VNEQAEATFDGWAIVELMGHRQRAGQVSEVEICGAKMLRIDIPAEPEPITEFYGGAAIYAIRPTSEEVARDFVRQSYDLLPVRPVEYRPTAAIEHHSVEDLDDDERSF
jgi:hypothetical protein